jgi:cyclopropane fatty-acyl-phospholipid synthase-like methyltransferase
MNKTKEMWDERYSAEEYAYGIAPNIFLKNAIENYKLKGKMLFPAEGEGRNAVYAAKNGLEVTAFDISIEGQNKAFKLSERENVEIKYEVGDFFDLDVINHQYDSAALIFAHFPTSLLSEYHKKIGDLIKPDGIIVLEGFSKKHLKLREADPGVGGPNNSEMLFSKESIQSDFPDFEIIQLAEMKIRLTEGNFHNGIGSVIRFIGRKK